MSTFALDQIQAQIPQALVERYTDRAGDAWGVIAREHIVEVARLLMEAGADINAQAANRDTPWLLAGHSGGRRSLR